MASAKVQTELWLEIGFEISGTFHPEVPERGPSYSSGGEPAEPAFAEDIEILRAWVEVPFFANGIRKIRRVEVRGDFSKLLDIEHIAELANDAICEDAPDPMEGRPDERDFSDEP